MRKQKDISLSQGRNKTTRAPNPFLQEMGKRLRNIEAEFKNRSEAAQAAGVAKSTFQTWVLGQRDPSFQALAKLCSVTGYSLDWLATGEGPMRPGAQNLHSDFEPVDVESLEAAEELVESWLRLHPKQEPPGGRAHLVADVYGLIESMRRAEIDRAYAIRVAEENIGRLRSAMTGSAAGEL